METCETCKHYEKCSKNIYAANIERKYIIYCMGGDCWEANEEQGVINMPDLDLTWMKEAIDKHYEKQDVMIRASRKAELTRDQLVDTCFKDGILAVYNLGLEHMYEYLKGSSNGQCDL